MRTVSARRINFQKTRARAERLSSRAAFSEHSVTYSIYYLAMAALPSLAPYSAYTRGRAMEVESRIARRRNQEEAMRQRWDKHWQYLQRRDIQSSKRAAWSSDQSRSPHSSNRRHTEEELEEKKRRLEERRRKLGQLLHDEQLSYEVAEPQLLNVYLGTLTGSSVVSNLHEPAALCTITFF